MTKDNDPVAQSSGFLSRWASRKAQVASGIESADVDSNENALVIEGDGSVAAESDEDAALSDMELLEKYELPDPFTVEEESGLDPFFDGKAPERLRQLALRRVWRLNPLFGFVDDMVEYGEDYTDAATVVEGMQTAYQVGKGYLKKVLSPEEELELPIEQAVRVEKCGDEKSVDIEVNKDEDSASVDSFEEVAGEDDKSEKLNNEELAKEEEQIFADSENQLDKRDFALAPEMLISNSLEPNLERSPSRMVFVKKM